MNTSPDVNSKSEEEWQRQEELRIAALRQENEIREMAWMDVVNATIIHDYSEYRIVARTITDGQWRLTLQQKTTGFIARVHDGDTIDDMMHYIRFYTAEILRNGGTKVDVYFRKGLS